MSCERHYGDGGGVMDPVSAVAVAPDETSFNFDTEARKGPTVKPAAYDYFQGYKRPLPDHTEFARSGYREHLISFT